ncbi:hypothetical protein C8R46DRAFT_1042854 [Mycena filopes]|nr:hypothetical protein C8R46DRAFT_1042854 [Mycena filopes]
MLVCVLHLLLSALVMSVSPSPTTGQGSNHSMHVYLGNMLDTVGGSSADTVGGSSADTANTGTTRTTPAAGTGDSGLVACFGSGAQLPLQSQGPPHCSTIKKLSNGTTIGATADVTLGFTSGTSSTLSMTTTSQ